MTYFLENIIVSFFLENIITEGIIKLSLFFFFFFLFYVIIIFFGLNRKLNYFEGNGRIGEFGVSPTHPHACFP